MFLKRLDTMGFKSFAERITVEFVPGVTAVVGPNGSGKSNITDSIRWVLGEQSAKSLRGSKMEDIIFAGSDTRKPLNIAEVTLTLDNQDHALPIDYEEVSVTRRVFRSGESEFLINNQTCRLKDIVELFMDSGLGREAFSIISQGKVEEILSSKSEERRTIFEEAAGVLKYKTRKKKAEYKLAETEENLNRVEDIIYEIENQLEPLKEQAAIAKDYLEKKEELEHKEVSLLVAEIEMLHGQWKTMLDTLEQKKDEEMKLRSHLQSEEAKLEEERGNIQALDESIEDLQETLLILTQELENLEGKKELVKERVKHFEENKNKLEQEKEQLISRSNHQEQQYNDEIAILEQLKENRDKTKKALNETLEQLSKLNVNTEEAIEELKSEYIEKLNDQAAKRNERQSIARQLEQISGKRGRLNTKFEGYLADRQTIEEQIVDLHAVLEEKEKERKQLETIVFSQKQELEKLRNDYQAKESKLYQAFQYLQKLRSKKEMLDEMKEDFAGFFHGVKEVLKAREKNELSGIVGAVAELIDIPNPYITGIETALGGQAQHIIVEDEQAARQAIGWLKKTNRGRATFLPLKTIQSRQISSSQLSSVKNISGFVGVASELIKYDANLSPAIEHLIGNVLIAETLTDANKIAQALNRRFRVVTLDGDVVNPGGSMSGGAQKKTNQSLFTREKELEELTEKLNEFEGKTNQFEQSVKDQKQAIAKLEENLSNDQEHLETKRYEEQTAKSNLREVELKEANLNEHLKLYDQEQSQFNMDHEELTSRNEQLEVELADLVVQLETIQTNIEQLTKEQTSQKTSHEQFQSKVNELQVAFAEQDTKVKNQQEKTQALVEQLDSSKQNLADLEQDIELLVNSQQNNESEDVLAERIVKKRNQKEASTKLIQSRRQERVARSQKVQDQERELKEQKRIHQSMMTEVQDLEVKSTRLDVELENRLEHLRTEYMLTFEKAKETYPKTENIEEAKQQVKLIKRAIEELGTVNLGSIEEYDRIKERYDFLTEQQRDLMEAKQTLFDVISEMDEEMERRFESTFVQIREEFVVVFKELFGGGRADLKLTDPDDILETGVDIVAQPPGKKLTHLGLLSGGERALTAIALLFAILRVRPVPFCVLDEVEAALDDANVHRFARFLKEFSSKTQFIVITHRKGTMEEADVLYGVTMQESGVSKLVSVRLEETKELVGN